MEEIGKATIELEKMNIEVEPSTCAKYLALEYEEPVSEELVEKDPVFDLGIGVNSYVIQDVCWFARKYMENQFLFENKFCQNVIIVKDVLSEISREKTGNICMRVGDGHYVFSTNADNSCCKSARCYLDMQDEKITDIVSKFKTGRQVSVIGVLKGYEVGEGFILVSCIVFEYDDEVIENYAKESISVFEEVVNQYNFLEYKKNKEKQARQEELQKQRIQEEIRIEEKKVLEEKQQKDFLNEQLKNVCPKCNKECGKMEKFCKYCGTKLNPPYVNVLQQILKENLIKSAKYDTYYFAPEIPTKIGDNAISAYASDISFDGILALYDTSIRNNGKTGMIFTENCLYYKQMLCKGYKIKYSSIKKICAKDKNVYVTTADGYTYDFWDHEMKTPGMFCELLNMIVELQKI